MAKRILPLLTSCYVAGARFDDLKAAGSEKAAKDLGKLRVEGKDYVVQEGDVMLFRTSA